MDGYKHKMRWLGNNIQELVFSFTTEVPGIEFRYSVLGSSNFLCLLSILPAHETILKENMNIYCCKKQIFYQSLNRHEWNVYSVLYNVPAMSLFEN